MTDKTQVEDTENQEGSDSFSEPDYGALVAEATGQEALEEESGIETPAEEAPPPESEATASDGVTQPVAEAEPTPGTPAEAAAATPAQPQEPTPAEQAAQPAQPEPEGPSIEEMNAEILDKLTQAYSFTPEVAAQLDDVGAQPSTYLPKILANIHQRVFLDVYGAMMRTLPEAVTTISTQTVREQQAEKSFFDRWPDLKGAPDKAALAIRMYRQMNPQAPINEVVERAGAMAMLSLGRAIPQAQEAAPESLPSTPPPTPAMPGGLGAPQAGRKPTSYEESIFAQMAEEMLNS